MAYSQNWKFCTTLFMNMEIVISVFINSVSSNFRNCVHGTQKKNQQVFFFFFNNQRALFGSINSI